MRNTFQQLFKLPAILAIFFPLATWADDAHPSPQAGRRGFGGGPPPGVYKSIITPHWFANDTKFWYLNSLPAAVERAAASLA